MTAPDPNAVERVRVPPVGASPVFAPRKVQEALWEGLPLLPASQPTAILPVPSVL